MEDYVALVKYEGNLEEALKKGIDLVGGFGNIESPIIIKPNICADYDRTGYAVTNVNVVESLIKIVLRENRAVPVKIVESNSESKWADEAFEIFGYTRLEKKMKESGFDVSLINLSKSPTTLLKLDGLYFKDLELPEILVRPNYFISLAVAKTHELASITGAMKNLFGLIPRKDHHIYHPHIHEVIVDLNRVVKPDLCIVDARVALKGWMGPKKRKLDTFIVGKNPASVDAAMAKIMELEPKRIQHLAEAEKIGLGSLNPKIVGIKT
jgi:uncharacterized protein (DUF362 family)